MSSSASFPGRGPGAAAPQIIRPPLLHSEPGNELLRGLVQVIDAEIEQPRRRVGIESSSSAKPLSGVHALTRDRCHAEAGRPRVKQRAMRYARHAHETVTSFTTLSKLVEADSRGGSGDVIDPQPVARRD